MESRICMFLLCSTMVATLFIHCGDQILTNPTIDVEGAHENCTIRSVRKSTPNARKSVGLIKDPKHSRSSAIKHTKKLQLMSKLMSLVIEQPTDTSNTLPYGVSSPFSLPPFDSLPPVNSPPYCVNPPNTPLTGPPSTTLPPPSGTTLPPPSPFYNFPPVLPGQSPPPSSGGTVPSPPELPLTPNPPETVLSPPSVFPGPPQAIPTPTVYIPSPPYNEPSPPAIVLSPPFNVPSPFGFNPSPPVFEPPVVFPPPTVPPPPYVTPSMALWCVAKPSVPEPIIQEAMNYACGSGADCDSIQPNGSCFQPDSLLAHASYAFNSYWQRTKGAGGTCDFGGTAILVTVDPSYDGCHFEYH